MDDNRIYEMIEEFKRTNGDNSIYDSSLTECFDTLATKVKVNNVCTNSEYADMMRYNNYIKENLEKAANKIRVLNWPSIECPFFTDEEINQLQGYYSDSSDEIHESWHDYFDEEGVSSITKSWSARIRDYQMQLQYTDDPKEIADLKQKIVDLGWNPEVEYCPESQAMARKRFIGLMSEKLKYIDEIDIQPLIEKFDVQDYVTESTKKSNIYPISLVLVRGNSIVAPAIAKVTKSDYTHSSLAVNGDFSTLYSFNFDNGIKLGGGISLEDMDKYPHNNKIIIYTLFVNEEDYLTLTDKLNWIVSHATETSYNLINLAFFSFKNVKFSKDNTMICSQFVDSCLKLMGINLNSAPSEKVSPAMLYRNASSNVKVYKTYDGLVGDFDPAKTSKFLKSLANKAKLFKESSILNNYFYPVVLEAKPIISVNKDGDILIRNPFVDFDAEYSASHKLLVEYDKAHNMEGMKYELARLYYMNYILERRINHNKFKKTKEKNIKTRARVLNDFKKYIKVVLAAEPNFNFAEYYESTQFYPHTVEVKHDMIQGLKKLLDYIL